MVYIACMAYTVTMRDNTRVKFEAIRKPRRWPVVEALDAIIDDFIAHNGIAIDAGDPSVGTVKRVSSSEPRDNQTA